MTVDYPTRAARAGGDPAVRRRHRRLGAQRLMLARLLRPALRALLRANVVPIGTRVPMGSPNVGPLDAR